MRTKKVTWISPSSCFYYGANDLQRHFVSPLQTVITQELFPLFTIHIGDGIRLADTHKVMSWIIFSHATHDESSHVQSQFVNR